MKAKLGLKLVSLFISVIMVFSLCSMTTLAEPILVPDIKLPNVPVIKPPILPELNIKVEFTDSVLREKIEKLLKKERNEAIWTSDINKYCTWIEENKAVIRHDIDWSKAKDETKSIVSLEGLQAFSNCYFPVIKLKDHNIADLTPLQGWQSLNVLDVSGNKIKSIDPLKSLTNILALNISNNPISDITALSQMPSITQIYADNTDIVDISPLDQMKNLEFVSMKTNHISKVPLFQSHLKLERLILNGNNISRIESLSGLTSLTTLELDNNDLTNVNFLKGLPKLVHLNVSGNSINNIDVLENLTNLTYLDLSYNFVESVEPLTYLQKLSTLNLSGNRLQDIGVLGNLDKIVDIRAADNWITSLEPIRNHKLEYVDLNNNKIDVNDSRNKLAINFWKSLDAEIHLDNQNLKKPFPEKSTTPVTLEPQKPTLTDIKGHWAEADIQWAYDNEIVNGVAPGLFNPGGITTEEQFLKILLIAMGALTEEPVSIPWSQKYYDYAERYDYPVHAEDRGRKISRTVVAELIAATQGQRLTGNNAIQYLLDHNLSKGKTAATIEGYYGNDFLTRAESVRFIRNVLTEAEYKTPQPLKK